jgi:signal transduction histidine kinase
MALFSAWLVLTVTVVVSFLAGQDTWYSVGKGLARYLIGFPGALLAAYGLGRHTLHRVAPLRAPHITQMLRVAGIALALYAIFSGLIPPPAIGLVLTVAVIRALDIFDLEAERYFESMEQQQVLAVERERIARELHDGVIQKVYSAGLLLQAARNHPETIESRLDHTLAILNDAISDLRRGLGELRAAPSDQSLGAALQHIAADPRFQMLMDISLEIDLPEEHLSSRTQDILAIVHEALSNVARHAHAEHVQICARRDDGHLCLTVQDDGIGLAPPLVHGNGMRNMQDRARLLGGELHVSDTGKGTVVDLVVPWEDES